MPRNYASLTIGTVAEQTGVSVPVLRSWEQRHGFPTATRLPSGHRRYTQQDVDAIIQVGRSATPGCRWKRPSNGPGTDAAPKPARSIFADLRAASPDLTPHTLSKRSMLAISRAIEDEFCARAERPLLIGSLPTRGVLPAVSRALAIARRHRRSGGRHGRLRLRPASDDTTDRVGPRRQPAAPAGVDDRVRCARLGGLPRRLGRPGQTAAPDADRMFEAIWTAEPPVVRQASHIGLDLIARQAPQLSRCPRSSLRSTPSIPRRVRRATELTNRIIAYLDR